MPTKRSDEFPGGVEDTHQLWCTRYGDVRDLIAERDNELVLFNGGDALTLALDASRLGTVPPGYRRDFFLYAVGWDKDADYHVDFGRTVEPLPFHGMDDQRYGRQPRPPLDDSWIERYNTRWVGPFLYDADPP